MRNDTYQTAIPSAAADTAHYVHRPHRLRCALCGDTGVIRTLEPALIGHASDGARVYSASRLVLIGRACDCRQGWPKGGAA